MSVRVQKTPATDDIDEGSHSDKVAPNYYNCCRSFLKSSAESCKPKPKKKKKKKR